MGAHSLTADKELAQLDALFVKQAYSGAVSFILEAVKWNSDGTVVKYAPLALGRFEA